MGAKKVFIKALAQNFEKANDPILKKHPNGQKDRQILFRRTLPATAGGPINIVNERFAFCYKIHTLLIRSSASPSIDNLSY